MCEVGGADVLLRLETPSVAPALLCLLSERERMEEGLERRSLEELLGIQLNVYLWSVIRETNIVSATPVTDLVRLQTQAT